MRPWLAEAPHGGKRTTPGATDDAGGGPASQRPR
jgi:hypothetical protein